MIGLTQEEKVRRAIQRKKYKYNKTHKTINGVEYKLCSICNDWLLTDMYYKNKSNNVDGLYPYCKSCAINKAHKWAINNRESSRILKEKYAKSDKGRERNNIAWKKRTQNGYIREYQRFNKEKIKFYQLKRKKKKHKISEVERDRCKSYFNYSCAYCGLSEIDHFKVNNQKLHLDHVDPNGANDLSNNVPACKSCNSSKGTNSLYSWYLNKSFYRQERYDLLLKWLNEDYKIALE